MAASTVPQSVAGLLQQAISRPLYQRCYEVTKLLQESSIKDLQWLVPTVIDSIFGVNNQQDWGLTRTVRSHGRDFLELRLLLSPQGALMQQLYRLMQDPHTRYEFPVNNLPYGSRQAIVEGGLSCPALYANKVSTSQAQAYPNAVLLNAFEYYMFQFVYFLINPQIARSTHWRDPGEALYTYLLDDYLRFYLPLESHKLPALPCINQPSKAAMSHHSPLHRSTLTSPKGVNAYQYQSQGVGAGIGLGTSPYMRLLSPHQVAPPPSDLTQHEIYRSHVFLQIMIEFWLNQQLSDGQRLSLSNQSVPEGALPTGEHVKVVRMIVKHLHYFANSASSSSHVTPPTNHQTGMPHTMDQLKREAIPHYLQKNLYAFLKNTFRKWPLDMSFRLVMETWLSYIQPWRYTNPNTSGSRDWDHGKDKSVDHAWAGFISDNLLFYTTLLQAYLPRVFRTDLASPKNAYMLFRVTKVFALPNLKQLIEEAESKLQPSGAYSRMVSPSRLSVTSQEIGASYLSSPYHPHAPHPHTAGGSPPQPTQHMVELEGSNFTYASLFGDNTRKTIQQLLSVVSQARTSVQAQKPASSSQAGWMTWLFGADANVDYNTTRFSTRSSDGYDDASSSDGRKLEAHLTQSAENLAVLFELESGFSEKSVSWGSSNGRQPENLKPDCLETDEGTVLSPLGRYQLMNRLRKFEVEYQGDPDLQPIRSFENAFLVRSLYQLSSFINQRFAEGISRMYRREDLVGRVAFQLLRPNAMTTRSPRKPHHGVLSPEIERKQRAYSQPRISLRWLGSYQNLGYILGLYWLLYAWTGLGIVGYFVLLLVLALFYGLIMAFASSRDKIKAA